MDTMLIAFNGTHETGQHLGDTIVSLKAAWLFAQNQHNPKCEKILLTLSPGHDLNFLWDKFVRAYAVEVIYDSFHAGNLDQRYVSWDQWRAQREIEGRPFTVYKELHRRVDGGMRQGKLCGHEAGLGRKNVFEYLYYGQEKVDEPCQGSGHFGSELVDYPAARRRRAVLIAPYAKCQGNQVFTFQYWDAVVRGLVAKGVDVTVNYNGAFCDDLNERGNYRKIFPDMKGLMHEVCDHKLVACGNTGVGWMAAACGVPLLGMQPHDSHFQDYRYEWCGVRSLVEILDKPDHDYCVRRIVEELERTSVLTTGCYDVLHPGHIRHLEESRAMGTRLVVALNSDASVRRLKGEGRPSQNQDDRATVLKALRCVDDVVIFDGDDATDIIHGMKPDILTNGCDHERGKIVGREFVESYGGRVEVTGGVRTVSSSAILSGKPAPRRTSNADVTRIVKEAEGLSVNPFAKLKFMADTMLETVELGGDIAELGVYKGGCSVILRRLAPYKPLHLFDTFTGTPIDDPLCHHKRGEWAFSLDEVRRNVGEANYHEGVFPESAAALAGRQFCFVMVDPDTYQGVKDAIAFFWPRLVTGGKMLFDDYGWTPCAGVQVAIDEAFPDNRREVNSALFACVVTK